MGSKLGLQLRPYVGVGAGKVQIIKRGTQIQTGTAHHDRRAAAIEDVIQAGPRYALVGSNGCRLGDVEDIQKVVWDTSLLLGTEFRRADVHPSIQLHRICVDHLAADPLGYLDGEIGLPGRGRSDDGQHAPTRLPNLVRDAPRSAHDGCAVTQLATT